MKKEGESVICDNMYELGGHYVKWNKSDRERQWYHLYLGYILKSWIYRNNKLKWPRVGVCRNSDRDWLKVTNFQLQDW